MPIKAQSKLFWQHCVVGTPIMTKKEKIVGVMWDHGTGYYK